MHKILDLENFYSKLGENIKAARKKRGYSQDDLTKHVGLTRTSIVNIEKGRQHPPMHVIMNIASLFNVDINELLPSPTEKKKSEILKTVKESISAAEKKFKDVNINQEKLSLFFKLSANK